MDATYPRDVPATLIVRLENGEEWEATDKDLERFGYVDRVTVETNFRRAWEKANVTAGFDISKYVPLGGEVVRSPLEAVGRLVAHCLGLSIPMFDFPYLLVEAAADEIRHASPHPTGKRRD